MKSSGKGPKLPIALKSSPDVYKRPVQQPLVRIVRKIHAKRTSDSTKIHMLNNGQNWPVSSSGNLSTGRKTSEQTQFPAKVQAIVSHLYGSQSQAQMPPVEIIHCN